MATWIKSGFWKNLCTPCEGYKGWLNLDELIDSRAVPGPQGPIGPIGPMGTLQDAYHGSFYSLLDQQASVPNVTQAIIFEETVLSNGVTVQQDLYGYYTKITFQYAGVYNIAFSGQLHHRSGGGPGETIHIWFRKNGTDIPSTNTRLTVPNSKYVVAAWNIFVSVNNGDYVQLVGYPDNINIVLEHVNPTIVAPIQPATPSVILTVNRIA